MEEHLAPYSDIIEEKLWKKYSSAHCTFQIHFCCHFCSDYLTFQHYHSERLTKKTISIFANLHTMRWWLNRFLSINPRALLYRLKPSTLRQKNSCHQDCFLAHSISSVLQMEPHFIFLGSDIDVTPQKFFKLRVTPNICPVFPIFWLGKFVLKHH